MRQEYHYTISRTDRICLIVFVLALLGWELVKYAIPSEASGTGYIARSAYIAETDVKAQNKSERFETKGLDYDQMEEEEIISPIHIMKATVEELKSIGLSGKVAYNIKKYTEAGGEIRNVTDLMKIYGMDSVQLKTALPLLIFPEAKIDSLHSGYATEYKPRINVPKSIDLNSATIEDLESLPGIGSVLADRIIKFRESLGGFFQVDQLKECFGLPPETFEKIKSSLIVNTLPARININEVDLTNFSHPYLPKKFPKMIQAYKNQHGNFKDASDLRKVYPPDSMWCEKILPYLRFQ